jgi:hypothetical protein
MKKRKTLLCKECEFLGTAHLDEDAWYVCNHTAATETFDGGRALDLSSEDSPYWCPRLGKKDDFYNE